MNCNTSSLSPYIPNTNTSWNLAKISHLYKRIAFGIRPTDAVTLLEKTPSQVIDELFETTINLPLSVHPEDDFIDTTNLSGQRRFWSLNMLSELHKNGMQGQMFLFWHNHFVTIYDRRPRRLYQYTNLLQEHSLGNFKDFTRAIGLDGQMLYFLNGVENIKDAPNENYARELYELFTLGEGNGYTEFDITETARALTGYNDRDGQNLYSGETINFIADNFDNGDKTIFGRTGNWGYDDVIDILFEEKGEIIAIYIVETLYQYFVNPDLPSGTIIEELAITFRENNFEITPLLKQLFKSEHFFDASTIDVIIKSPIDLGLILHRSADLTTFDTIEQNRFSPLADELGQVLFTHPDVFGWPGDKAWISSPNFINTWEVLDGYLTTYFSNVNRDREDFRQAAITLSNNSADYKIVSKAIMDWFLPANLLNDQDYTIAEDIFRSNVPSNQFENNIWNLNHSQVPLQVSTLLKYIVKLPAFHLK